MGYVLKASCKIKSGSGGAIPDLNNYLFLEFDASFRVNTCIAQLFLDAEKLIVFSQPVGTGGAAGLDLTAVEGYGEVGDRRVFRFPAAMAHNSRITVSLS